VLKLTCQHDSFLQPCLFPGGSAELPEQLDEHGALGLREPTRGRIHGRLVTGEYAASLLFSLRGEPNDAGPPIALVDSRVTMPRASSRSTAVVIAPLVSAMRRPISLTGCGPL